ncbi:MAG TPA: hypothetical protein VLB85_07280 [Acidimicrobiia bacterium]|nr:hypothetical protein [Acidimicrobiia bacterium]
MNRRIDVIELLRGVNPVPPGAVTDEAVPTFDEALGSSFERTETMSQTTIAPPETPARSRKSWPKFLGAAAALVVAVGLVVPLTLRVAGTEWNGTPTEQRAAIEQVMEAVNGGDSTGFARAFGEDATFNAQAFMNFIDRDRVIPQQDPALVESIMAVIGAWEVETVLESCQPQTELLVRCPVRHLWHVAQAEFVADWVFAFDGGQISSAGIIQEDLDPADRTMPLSWLDLTGAMTVTGSRDTWWAWVAENDPDLFERMGDGLLEINGVAFESSLFMGMDPSLAPEIRESVDRYLAEG